RGAYALRLPKTPRELLGLLVQHLDENLGRGTGRGRILTGDEQAIGENVRLPVAGLGEEAALRLQLVLDKEAHDLGQANRLLLALGEAGDLLALKQRLAVGPLGVTQHAGRVAYKGKGLAGAQRRLDQLDRVRVLSQVPHRPVAAGVEDAVEILRLDA